MRLNIKSVSFIVMIIVTLFSVGYLIFDYIDDTISISDAEEFMSIAFPNSSENFKLSYNSFLDASLRVRFNLPSSSYETLRTYLDTVCVDIEILSQFNPYPIDDDWWTPSQAEIFEGGQCRDVQNRNFRVLIDKTNSNMYTVFLSAS